MTNRSRVTAPKRQKGFSLLETAIVLAVVAAVLFGLFVVYGVVQAKRITQSESSALTMMASDLRTKFSNQGSFAGLSNANAIKLNIIPKAMINGTNITTGFGTNVTIAAANVNGTANDGYSFTYDVPSDNCSDFVSAAESAFSRVSIGGNVVKNLPGGDAQLTVTDLAECNATATGNANTTVVFSQAR